MKENKMATNIGMKNSTLIRDEGTKTQSDPYLLFILFCMGGAILISFSFLYFGKVFH